MIKRSLEERLSLSHPDLLKRFEDLASLVDNENGKITSADQAEQQAIEAVRSLGKEIMQGWAEGQNKHRYLTMKQSGIQQNGKKKSIGIPPLEK